MKTKKIDFIKLCYDIANCPEDIIQEQEKMAEKQFDYVHPFKRATQIKFNSLWEHNLKVIKKFRELQLLLKESI